MSRICRGLRIAESCVSVFRVYCWNWAGWNCHVLHGSRLLAKEFRQCLAARDEIGCCTTLGTLVFDDQLRNRRCCDAPWHEARFGVATSAVPSTGAVQGESIVVGPIMSHRHSLRATQILRRPSCFAMCTGGWLRYSASIRMRC